MRDVCACVCDWVLCVTFVCDMGAVYDGCVWGLQNMSGFHARESLHASVYACV